MTNRLNRSSTIVNGLVSLLIIEIIIASLLTDPYLAVQNSGGISALFLQNLSLLVKFFLAAAILLAFVLAKRFSFYANMLFSTGHRYRLYWVALHLLLFSISLVTSFQLERNAYQSGIALWVISGLSASLVWFLCVAPMSFWLVAIKREWKSILVAFVLAATTVYLSLLTGGQWGVLGSATFDVSYQILSWISSDVVVYPESKELGAGNFLVKIAPECAGYEGIGLLVAFIAVYIYVFRQQLKLNRTWLFFVVGIPVIWLLNALRIAVLVKIGAEWSPSVAVGGFHSQAGWIFFIICSLLILQLSKHPFFLRATHVDSSSSLPDAGHLSSAILFPILVLFGSTILTDAFTADFPWLYPVKVIFTAVAIVYFWRLFAFLPYRLKLEPVVAGILVAVIWWLLVDVNIEMNNLYQSALGDMANTYSVIWLVFRFLGFVLIVPIAEELAFRGYLLCRLSKQDGYIHGELALSVLAISVSSLAFGVLHGDWLAGTVAGIVFALVRIRSNTLVDAIVAHSVANAVLFVLALFMGSWYLL